MLEPLLIGGEFGGLFVDVSYLSGKQRIEMLRRGLQELENNQAALFICSKGLIAPIRLILERCGLLGHFVDVYARLYDYEVEGNPYDDESYDAWTVPESVSGHLDRRANQEWRSKGELCRRLAGQYGETVSVMLVEDDPSEIARGKKAGCDTCYVKEREGVTEKHMQELLRWASSTSRKDPNRR